MCKEISTSCQSLYGCKEKAEEIKELKTRQQEKKNKAKTTAEEMREKKKINAEDICLEKRGPQFVP